MALPTDYTAGQSGHVAAHEQVNTEVNRVALIADALPADLAEYIRDTISDTLVQGANVAITKDDTGNTITIASTGGSGGGGGEVDASQIVSGTVPVDRLGASGTRDATTYLRGDNAWVSPPAGGGSALPRLGGVYSNANSGALVRATVTAATLVHVSGDNLVDGSGAIVIPSEGVWSLSVTWMADRAQSGRCFVEAVGLRGNPRASLVGGEDRVTLSWVGPAAQNQHVTVRAFCDQAETLSFDLDVSCYRVGI